MHHPLSSARRLLTRLATAALLALAACSDAAAPSAASTSGAPSSSAATIAGAALILDVREPSEFSAGHLERAENIPVGQVEARIDEIVRAVDGDKSKPIVVYCAAGGRAGRAKATLEKAGFQNVTNAGGYDQLKGAR